MNQRAFTILELSVVTGIIVVLTALLLPNWKEGQKQFALQRSTHKLAQDIRRVQEMALAAERFHGQVPFGYGIYFSQSDPSHYILFADLTPSSGNQEYDPGVDGIVETVPIENNSLISQLSADPLTIVFVPPEPKVIIKPAGPGFVKLTSGEKSQEVCVNNVGLIEVASSCFRNNSPIAVSCQVSPAAVSSGQATVFTLSGVATDPDGNETIAGWHWDWGDGSEITVILNPTNQSHTYNLPLGETTYDYTPKLRVVDNQGASSGNVPCNSVTVNELPPAQNAVGYAWSDTVGWIDFCPMNQSAPGVAPPKAGDTACASLDSVSGKLTGWARIVSTGSWISLSCQNDPLGCTGPQGNYGVNYDSVTYKFSGSGWSTTYGWVCFSSDTCP